MGTTRAKGGTHVRSRAKAVRLTNKPVCLGLFLDLQLVPTVGTVVSRLPAVTSEKDVLPTLVVAPYSIDLTQPLNRVAPSYETQEAPHAHPIDTPHGPLRTGPPISPSSQAAKPLVHSYLIQYSRIILIESAHRVHRIISPTAKSRTDPVMRPRPRRRSLAAAARRGQCA